MSFHRSPRGRGYVRVRGLLPGRVEQEDRTRSLSHDVLRQYDEVRSVAWRGRGRAGGCRGRGRYGEQEIDRGVIARNLLDGRTIEGVRCVVVVVLWDCFQIQARPGRTGWSDCDWNSTEPK